MISLDFSSQTCWPSASPYSPAQAVTTCRGPRSFLRVVAAAGRLAVEGDDRPIDARLGDGLVAEAGDPGVEGGLEGRGLEQHQDAAEDVLAGDAVGQVEDAREELLLELGPAGDGGGPGGAGEDGQDGDDQDAGQRMPPVDVGAGILQGGEGSHDLVQLGAGARHRRPPATGCGSRHGGRYTRSGGGAQARKVYQIVIKVRAGRGRFPRLKKILADGIYNGDIAGWAKEIGGWILKLVVRDPDESEEEKKKFKVLKWCWIVERTFAWLGRHRRMSKDYEGSEESSESWI